MKLTPRLQKYVFLSFFFVSIALLVYALGYFTSLNNVKYDVITDAARAFDVLGPAQTFNKLLFNLSFFGLVLAAIPLLFDNQKRKNFYLSNIVFGIVGPVYSIGVAVFLFIQSIHFKALYMQVDFTFIAIIQGVEEMEPNPAVFNTGMILAVLIVLIACATIITSILKYQETSRRFASRKGGLTHE